MMALLGKWAAYCFARRAFALARRTEGSEMCLEDAPVLSLICALDADVPDVSGVERIANSPDRVAALRRTKGAFVVFLQPQDRLASGALETLVRALRMPAADAGLVYGDAFLSGPGGKILKPVLKPAFDPVLFKELDYISGFVVFRRDRLISCIDDLVLADTVNWEQNWVECYLKGLDEENVVHIPYPLVQTPSAPTRRPSAMLPNPERQWPPVTVVIPSRNGFDLISLLLRGLFNTTDYPDLTVHVIDNGSDDPRVLALYAETRSRFPNFFYEINPEPFNFSRSVNRGLAKVSGGHALLLNNDVEMISPIWLKEMVSCLDYPGVGIVGAKLLYPDGKLQHSGVIAGMGGLASHWYYKCSSDIPGHFGRLQARNSMTCVTAAVMLISQHCLTQVSRWDEENFAVAYNDVDYCLRAYKAGFRAVWTPFANLVHHESVSRGKDKNRLRKAQFRSEKRALQTIHGTEHFEDPAFSPWLSKRPGRFRFRWRRDLPAPRRWWKQA